MKDYRSQSYSKKTYKRTGKRTLYTDPTTGKVKRYGRGKSGGGSSSGGKDTSGNNSSSTSSNNQKNKDPS